MPKSSWHKDLRPLNKDVPMKLTDANFKTGLERRIRDLLIRKLMQEPFQRTIWLD